MTEAERDELRRQALETYRMLYAAQIAAVVQYRHSPAVHDAPLAARVARLRRATDRARVRLHRRSSTAFFG